MATENDSKCVWNYNSIKKLYDELKDKKRTDDEEKEFLFVEALMSNNASIEGFSFDEGLDYEKIHTHNFSHCAFVCLWPEQDRKICSSCFSGGCASRHDE